jgi:hypothetical protein
MVDVSDVVHVFVTKFEQGDQQVEVFLDKDQTPRFSPEELERVIQEAGWYGYLQTFFVGVAGSDIGRWWLTYTLSESWVEEETHFSKQHVFTKRTKTRSTAPVRRP